MSRITHMRNISYQWTKLSKAMIIKTGWLIVIIISLWKRARPFIQTCWIPFFLGCFVLKLARWFWRNFWYVVNVLLLLSPLGNGRASDSIKTYLIALIYCKRILGTSSKNLFFYIIFTILPSASLEKGTVPLYLNKLEISSPKNAWCQVWMKKSRGVLEKMKMWKVHRKTDRHKAIRKGELIKLNSSHHQYWI